MYYSAQPHFSSEQVVALQRARNTLDDVADALRPAARALREVCDVVPGTSRGLRALHQDVVMHLIALDAFRAERIAIRERLHG